MSYALVFTLTLFGASQSEPRIHQKPEAVYYYLHDNDLMRMLKHHVHDVLVKVVNIADKLREYAFHQTLFPRTIKRLGTRLS